jgi:hypothetical protein
MKKNTRYEKEIEKLSDSIHRILYPDWPENTLPEEEYDRRWASEEVQSLLWRRQSLEIAMEEEKGRRIWEFVTGQTDDLPVS